jgi:NAD(P)-dependent dehydrogenase (short-subunit alcohol dehydrogenase family)
MKTVVITGSTRGIGFSLAKAFLRHDCRVVISGRNKKSVNAALKKLAEEFPSGQTAGIPCDVKDYQQVQALWDQAAEQYGPIDIWINNAGISNQQNPPWEVPSEELRNVVETNLLGELFGTKAAISGFQKQGYGALYNMEGMGARNNRTVKGLSIYGASKAAIGYFNQAAAAENETPNILICALQPGMILTDMVMNQYESRPEEWLKVEGILRMISSDVDETASWLVEKILANKKNGIRIQYGGTLRILGRMIRSKINPSKPAN